MFVLSILSKEKSDGYEIIKELEEHNLKLKGMGNIYPILINLKDQECVNTYREMTKNGKVRVYYEINFKNVSLKNNQSVVRITKGYKILTSK